MDFRFLMALGATALLGVGCSEDDPEPTPVKDATVFDVGGGGEGGGAGGEGGDGGGGPTRDALRLTYTKQAGGRTDLMLFDFEEDAELNLTSGAGITCSQGCIVNADMSWLAWVGGTEDPNDRALKVAPIDVVRKQVRVDRTRVVVDQVGRFEFTGDLLVYETGEAAGTERTVEILTEPIVGCADGAGDCPQFVGQIAANGGFRVADVGQVVVVLDVSLSAMTVNLFNAANGLSQTIHTFGEEGGAGSPFAGRQPVGMSPDQSYMVAFTSENFLWKAQILELRPSPPPPVVVDLFEVESAPGGKCARPMPFNFTQVEFNPVFAADSEYFYFLSTGACSQAPGADPRTNRPDADILRLARNASTPEAVENITNNPRVSHWSNQNIRDFDLSPDGRRLAYAAPLPNDAQSQGIWIIDPDSKAFDCSRFPGQEDLSGVRRCEFIASPDEAGVRYRNLQFVTVQVPQ